MRVAELKAGMVLGEAVKDVNGRLLMGEGASLSERSIGVLKAWGIGEVAICGEKDRPACSVQEDGADAPESEAFGVAAERLRLSNLEHRFVHDVLRLSTARLSALLKQGEGSPQGQSGEPASQDVKEGPPLDLHGLITSNPALGAMPEVLSRLAQSVEDPTASPVETANIIMADPALAARLLKVVNSAMYGFPQRIETVTRAVTVIGVRCLSALALGLAAMDAFKGVDKTILDIRAFWRHCLACACAARAIASLLGIPNTERYFVAGLLHDVGLLLLIQHEPQRVRPVLAAARAGGEDLVTAERRLLGVDHAQAGAALLAAWGLPASLVQAAGSHHDPMTGENPGEAAIVHVADFLADALAFGSSGQCTLMPLDTDAFDQLGAPSGLAGLVFERVDAQLDQLESIFLN